MHVESLPAATADSVSTLRSMLVGSFSSSEQAAADPDYRDIRLHMAPCWTSRNDGPWLYVEQAMSTALDKPYRQRVYRLSKLADRLYQSQVYELASNPESVLRFTGEWSKPTPLADITPADLILKDGCEVILKYDPASGHFKGGTVSSNCETHFRNAAYASSEIDMGPALLVSWDRGFDASGKQVWGAEKGGYRFVKQP